MISPRFTIIIPTRERAATLEHALATVTAQDFASLEIIVSDNASTDNTRAIVEANGDPRIRYINTGSRLSMSHNYEFALRHARGEWVGIIGDDDGLMPDGLAQADAIARAHDVDLIRSQTASYLWPSLLRSVGGQLNVPLGGDSGLRSCADTLKAVLAGTQSYLTLPIIYTGGFVKRTAIDRLRTSDGRFFLSRIPDVYSAVALSATCENFYWSAQPLAINGASMASTGTSYFALTDDPERQKAQRLFDKEGNLPLHSSLPHPEGRTPRSLHALVYESYQQARTIRPDLPVLDPTAQVLAIARTAGIHREEVACWLVDFAALHGVAKIPDPVLVHRFNMFKERARSAWMDRLIFYPDRQPPITNIAEASRIAGAALDLSPSATATAVRNIARRIGRALR